MGSHHVAQVALKLVSSNNPPTSVSQVAKTTDVQTIDAWFLLFYKKVKYDSLKGVFYEHQYSIFPFYWFLQASLALWTEMCAIEIHMDTLNPNKIAFKDEAFGRYR